MKTEKNDYYKKTDIDKPIDPFDVKKSHVRLNGPLYQSYDLNLDLESIASKHLVRRNIKKTAD